MHLGFVNRGGREGGKGSSVIVEKKVYHCFVLC